MSEASLAGFEYRAKYRPAGSTATSSLSQAPPPAPEVARTVELDLQPETKRRRWVATTLPVLEELLNLGDNWNGYGERPVHPASVKRFAAIMEAVDYDGSITAIVPLADGGIQAEWHSPDRSVEVMIPPTGEAIAWSSLDDEEFPVNAHEGVPHLREVLAAFAEE